MAFVVEAETAHGTDIAASKGAEKQADVGGLGGHFVGAEDIAADYVGAGYAGDVGYAFRQDSVTVIGVSVAGEKADEAGEGGHCK